MTAGNNHRMGSTAIKSSDATVLIRRHPKPPTRRAKRKRTNKAAGHTENYSLRVDDRDHGTVGHNIRNVDDPARLAILNFIAKQSANR